MVHYKSAFLYCVIIVIVYEHVYKLKLETAKSIKAVTKAGSNENEEYKLMYRYVIHCK